MSANSNRAAVVRKPRPGLPTLSTCERPLGQKVRGNFRYFGKCADDPNGEAALELWLAQKDELLAGREPSTNREGLTVGKLCSDFLAAKRRLLENDEITPRTWDDNRVTTDRIVAAFGKKTLVDCVTADYFEHLRAELAKTLGVVALSNAIRRIRSVFRYGYEAGLIQQPVRRAGL